MVIAAYLRTFVIGLAVAAVVGPISLLCLLRTLERGWAAGFRSGLGAATADGCYGAVAAFGLTVVTSALVAAGFWLRLVGGLFLCAIGITTAWSAFRRTARPAMPTGRLARAGEYGSTLGLTLTNPLTILSFAAIFAGQGLSGGQGDWARATAMTLGVFSGSACWWLILASLAAVARERLTPTVLRGISVASGVIILLFGLVALSGIVR